jgi:hypothetical protein
MRIYTYLFLLMITAGCSDANSGIKLNADGIDVGAIDSGLDRRTDAIDRRCRELFAVVDESNDGGTGNRYLQLSAKINNEPAELQLEIVDRAWNLEIPRIVDGQERNIGERQRFATEERVSFIQSMIEVGNFRLLEEMVDMHLAYNMNGELVRALVRNDNRNDVRRLLEKLAMTDRFPHLVRYHPNPAEYIEKEIHRRFANRLPIAAEILEEKIHLQGDAALEELKKYRGKGFYVDTVGGTDRAGIVEVGEFLERLKKTRR